MIRIFTGEDRIKAKQEVAKILGDDYEVIEGVDLMVGDLPSVFKGASLFVEQRNILIRDMAVNREVFEKLPEYLDTPHNVIILELKLDKRSVAYKAVKDKVEIREFALPKDKSANMVFDVYRTAKKDGKQAVKMLEEIRPMQDAMMFFGLMVSQALKDYKMRQGVKEKRALKELAKLDLDMKSSKVEPWLLVEGFLLRLGGL